MQARKCTLTAGEEKSAAPTQIAICSVMHWPFDIGQVGMGESGRVGSCRLHVTPIALTIIASMMGRDCTRWLIGNIPQFYSYLFLMEGLSHNAGHQYWLQWRGEMCV